jgi:hypothetical protein
VYGGIEIGENRGVFLEPFIRQSGQESYIPLKLPILLSPQARPGPKQARADFYLKFTSLALALRGNPD